LFERLSKSTRKFNPELLQIQKENDELRECTFKPETNKKSTDIAHNQAEYTDKDKFYERLYKEGEAKDQYMRSL
jgi:hypothetical protein